MQKIIIRRKKMRIIKTILLLAVLIFLASCSSGSVKENDSAGIAPDFNLPDQDGKSTTLKDLLRNNRGAVLAFYPKDDSKN